MTYRNNIEARRKNAISDLNWYEMRLKEVGIVAMDIPKFSDYRALLSEPIPHDAKKPVLDYTLLLTRNLWTFLHDFDGMLIGAIIPHRPTK